MRVFPEHKFSSDRQQVIKGGQTFEGRVYLIGLGSDIELLRGRNKRVLTGLISIPAESEHSDL